MTALFTLPFRPDAVDELTGVRGMVPRMPTWRLLLVALGLATACHQQGAALTTSAKTSPAGSATRSEAPTAPVDPVSITQLPELDIFATTVRVIIPNVEDAVAIDTRDDHDPPEYCARLRSGQVSCWRGPSTCMTPSCSYHDLPPLGDGCGTSPPEVDGEYGTSPLKMERGCAIRSDRRALCRGWGKSPIVEAVEVAGTPLHGSARTQRGELWSWTRLASTDATQDRIGVIEDAAQIVTNAYPPDSLHCVRTDGGAVHCWGLAASRRDPSRTALEPRRLPEVDDAIDIALHRRLCVVRRGGSVLCSSDLDPSPLSPMEGFDDAIDAEFLSDNLCVRTRHGTVRCAGSGYKDNQTVVDVQGAVEVERLVAISAAHCAVTRTGEHRCWSPGPSPRVHRVPALEGARDVAGRCVLQPDGHVTCWGARPGCSTIIN